MRIQIVFRLGILILLTSCGCPDDAENNFTLNEFENGIIPFETTTEVDFEDENSVQFVGTYSDKQTEIKDIDSGNDEECFATNIETQFIVLTIPDKSINLEISLGKTRGNRTTFTIENMPELFVIDECLGIVENVEEKLTDVSVQNFTFNSIFDFNPCSENSEIERILYSRNNGVEFIEFSNGSYLRLN